MKELRICTICRAMVPSGYISGCCHAMVSVLTLDDRDMVIERRTAKPGDEWVETDGGMVTGIDFGKGPDQTVEAQCERLPDGWNRPRACAVKGGMTTEEFHSHFMAMLSGPKRSEVIDELGAAIVYAVAATAARNGTLGAAIDSLIGPVLDDVLNLQILSALGDICLPADAADLRIVVRGEVRQRLREHIERAGDDGKAIAILREVLGP